MLEKLEKLCWVVTQGAIAFLAVLFCVRLCCGCTILKQANANEKIVTALKEAYANGGASSVSNRIEKYVADGTLSVKQAEKLHALAQKIYDGVIEKLESEIGETDLDAK